MPSEETVSAEEMGQALWWQCRKFTDEFCTRLMPKFQAQGFLKNPAEQDAFALEALQLYFWLISYVFTDDGAVLDALHKIFYDWDSANCQARASQTVQERFSLYTQACHQDIQRQAKGDMPTHLRHAALQCLLNNGKPDERIVGWEVGGEVGFSLWTTFPNVQHFRAKFKIRRA
jgi:hypothetical protein